MTPVTSAERKLLFFSEVKPKALITALLSLSPPLPLLPPLPPPPQDVNKIAVINRLVANINFEMGYKGRSPLKSPPQGLPCGCETQFCNMSIIEETVFLIMFHLFIRRRL